MKLVNALKNLYWLWRLRGEQLAEGFDSTLYSRLHRDVAISGVNGRVHYLRFGRAEGRDPHPDFSASGYRYQHRDLPEQEDPFVHYERFGRREGYAALPEWDGAREFTPNNPTWLVCGHQAGKEVYGGERSLLDILAYLSELCVNTVVVLPGALNHDYITQVTALSCRVIIVPYGWWHRDCPSLPQTQKNFERILTEYRCNAVYVNTSVLDEPLLAARAVGTPVIVHVRELPEHDPDLCATLGANADEVRERLINMADLIVANSDFTASTLGIPNTMVVPNSIDITTFETISFPVERGDVFSVGIISSNQPKKGIDDFVMLASELESRGLSVRCVVIGPDTTYLRRLRGSGGRWPGNLEVLGYHSSPEDAIAQVDLLVSLSHCFESFGRTVLEAMAAGRPVVAYDRGAVSDLVVHSETGYLVPYHSNKAVPDRVALVADRVEQLLQDQEKYRTMSMAARRSAGQRYSKPVVRESLRHVLLRSTDLQRAALDC
ncbi:glycosyltransferase family 4 protein [Marinimicrobium sp. LS-A18]|uniref:glycosyltransferase family 4 protein n=1 Tax=Marinimicrobium sp. LS-A18 TaxID=1381596 RepID=UPI00187C6878|nr:glycosyltransferase family 4 protein [Marinimicrobium sp. LS-A18]